MDIRISSTSSGEHKNGLGPVETTVLKTMNEKNLWSYIWRREFCGMLSKFIWLYERDMEFTHVLETQLWENSSQKHGRTADVLNMRYSQLVRKVDEWTKPPPGIEGRFEPDPRSDLGKLENPLVLFCIMMVPELKKVIYGDLYQRGMFRRREFLEALSDCGSRRRVPGVNRDMIQILSSSELISDREFLCRQVFRPDSLFFLFLCCSILVCFCAFLVSV